MTVSHPLAGLQSHIAASMAHATQQAISPSDIVLAQPKQAPGMDIAVSAAMRFAPKGQAKAVADAVVKALQAAKDTSIAHAQVDGPGYINIRLSATALAAIARWAIDAGPTGYGKGAYDPLQRPVSLEFVSANPTGPLHVGHTRGAVLGDSLARILAFQGQAVVREYYVNDAGNQIDALGRSALARWSQAAGLDAAVPEDGYQGAYLAATGAALHDAHGAPGADALAVATPFAVGAMLDGIQSDLGALGVRFDRFLSEQEAHASHLERALAALADAGHLYEAVPGQNAEGGGGQGLCLLMRTTAFGDDQDRVVRKSDGSYTYFAGDIARFARAIDAGERRFVLVLGVDHAGYTARLQAAVSALSHGQATLDVVPVGLVSLMEDGEAVTMSKRAGRFATMRDLLDEVGPDAVRCSMLSLQPRTPIAFDIEVAKSDSKHNPAFYLQYAAARLASSARAHPVPQVDPSAFDDADRDLMVKIALWPFQAQRAAQHLDPHAVYQAAMGLAQSVHTLWAAGNGAARLRFAATPQRAAVAAAAASALGAALRLLGIVPLERMEREEPPSV